MSGARSLNPVGVVLLLGAVGLAVASTRVSYHLTRQRESTCNGLLPMPGSAFLLGWFAVGVAAISVVVLIVRLRMAGGALTVTFLVVAVVALLFAAFVVYTVYGDAPTSRFLCSG